MARQSFMWTALPNGYTADGSALRVSVLLSPRLEPQAQAKALSTFAPDWTDWPAALMSASVKLSIGANSVQIPLTQTTGPNRVDLTYGGPDSTAWQALFPADLFVRPYAYQDLSNHEVLSYDTVGMADVVKGFYSQLAGSANGQMPKVSDLVDNPRWSRLTEIVAALDRSGTDRKTGLRQPERQFTQFMRTGFASEDKLAQNFARFQLFHTPPIKSKAVTVPRPEDSRVSATWLEHERKPLPTEAELVDAIDFHQVVAAMNAYPTLLRRLGLVIDLVIDPAPFTKGADVLVSAAVAFAAGALTIPRTKDVSPVTHTRFSATRFQPVAHPSLPATEIRVVDGLADLSAQRFELLQADVDGAGLKLMNFARTLNRLKPDDQRVDLVTRFEKDLGAPALRTAGLMLVHRDRGSMLKHRLATNTTKNTAAEKVFQNQAGAKPPELWAEDLVRGFRIDIWDRKTAVWRSLCEREATYDLNDGAMVITPAAPEEGTVRLAATKAPDPATNPNLLSLHEALVSWTGWSLTAPPPGRAIKPDDTVDKTTATTDAEVPAGVKLRSQFKARPGSLPRLRFGREYWLRARAVDLAGNSLAPSEASFGIENPEQRARPYLRFEPLAAPVLALLRPAGGGATPKPVEGESMDRMAIRTFNDLTNAVPHEKDSWRIAVPPQVSIREAEQHGALDAAGVVNPSTFPMLANDKDRDATDPLASPRLEKIPMKGPLDLVPIDTTFAVYNEGTALTYLPDPLAVKVAVRVFGHPHIPDSDVLDIPLYATGTSWPHAAPFRIRVTGGAGAKPTYDAATHTLVVPLPQGVRARLRLSMQLNKQTRALFGVWNWLTPAEQAPLDTLSRQGQHWMLTPWRTVEVVHAVQRPLIVPELYKLVLTRGANTTSVIPRFSASCSVKSTDKLDLRAEWHEPQDSPTADGSDAQQIDLSRGDTAFSIRITDPKSYALKLAGEARGGYPEHLIESEDRIAVGQGHDQIVAKRHEFHDTRYRRIEYWLEGTTKFREYMPAAVLTQDVGGTPVPIDDHIKVAGPRVVNWIPSSAPPPAPEVLYVVPTFGWTRGEDAAGQPSSWRRGGGLRVYLDRPWNVSGYGEMLAVVLPPAGLTQNPDVHPSNQPYKNFVTQWANDPIWLSPFVSGIAPTRGGFPLARTAPDAAGAWLPMGAPASEADQRPGPFMVTNLLPPGAAGGASAPLVEVAPHDVQYDADRRLWYCDIEVNTGSYYPFIRLALARYQPTSITGAHLSNVVLADIMPLAADRWVNVTHASGGTRHVAVYGVKYTDTSSRREASSAPSMSLINPITNTHETLEPAKVSGTPVFEAWLEKLDPSLGEDFGWQRIAQGVTITVLRPRPMRRPTAAERSRAGDLIARRRFDLVVKEGLVDVGVSIAPIWEGDVVLPAFEGSARYRLVIAEYEEYLADDSRPYDPVPTKKDRRLVFVEHVDLA
jgi:hypothetical protein